jgi:hypothetical protein
VKVSPAKVHRGHRVKLTIATVPETSLTVAVRYRTGKPTTYHGKTDGKGGASVRWTVPAAAALGKATAKVTAEVSGKSQLLSVTFTVLK